MICSIIIVIEFYHYTLISLCFCTSVKTTLHEHTQYSYFFSVAQFLAQNKGKIYHIFYLFDIYFVELTKIHRFFHDFSNPLWYILPYDFTIFATFCLTVPFSHPLDMLEPHLRNPPPSQSGTDMSANIGEIFQKKWLIPIIFQNSHRIFRFSFHWPFQYSENKTTATIQFGYHAPSFRTHFPFLRLKSAFSVFPGRVHDKSLQK